MVSGEVGHRSDSGSRLLGRSRPTMVTTFDKAIQKLIAPARCSLHYTSYLWALCQEFVRSTIHRPVAANGAGLPFSEPSGIRTSSECWSRLPVLQRQEKKRAGSLW